MIVGGAIQIGYVGADPSCLITADSAAKTVSAARGVLGAEAADAAFGVAGTIDLTLAAVDTLVKLAALIDSYADYTCTVLYGEDVSPQAVVSAQGQTHLAGALKATAFFQVLSVAGTYCTQLDITSEMQNIPPFTTTTKPTVTEVSNWCGDISADIDALLSSLGITLPVVDVDRLIILKNLAIWGVCARVLRSLEMQSDASAMYQDLYDKKVKQITANPGLIAVSATPAVLGPTSSFTPAVEVERKFHREEQDW